MRPGPKPEFVCQTRFPVEYRAWKHMRERCMNPKCKAYKNYGGRGIVVCSRWQSFKNFFEDVGPKPSSKHTLERINNNLGYDKNNCKWATWSEQAKNKRPQSGRRFITHKHTTLSISEWARKLGIPTSTLVTRLHRGWSDSRSLCGL